MCTKDEMDELVLSYSLLPNMYQQNILGIVRDKIRLYQIEQIKIGIEIGFRVTSSTVNYNIR
jgi:hypothetical protein